MGTVRPTFAAVITSLALASTLAAQVVVDRNGGGDFTDLQQAIDSVPPGTVIKVVGGTWAPITVPKSLTIMGDPPPRIEAPLMGSGPQPPGVTLNGAGSDRLTLADVVIAGRTNGASWTSAGAAIAGSGFAELSVLHVTAHAHLWESITGDAAGTPAIDVTGAARVIVVDSDVRANYALTDVPGRWGADGAPAIRAPAATVYAFDSVIRGGAGGESFFFPSPPTPNPCPCSGAQVTGRGGAGVEAMLVYESGSTVSGGLGGPVFWRPTSGVPWNPWGQQPSGPAFDAATVRQIADDVIAWAPMRLGAIWAIGFAPLPQGGLLIAGSGLRTTPIPIGATDLLISGLYFSIPLAVNSSSFAFQIPDLSVLGGVPFVFQVLDVAAVGVKRPIVDVVGF